MTRQRVLALCAASLVLLSSTPLAHATRVASGRVTVEYTPYARTLTSFVNTRGLVDYRHLKANRLDLDAFARSLEAVAKPAYENWTESDRIAFWLNAYNALTLVAIVDHYPIQPSLLGWLRFPSNSIRQIPGVWDELRFVVKGEALTLDEIEHQILREQFSESRIHLALVCAAQSCPHLRTEPYEGGKLEPQLNDQSRRFLQDPRNFSIHRDTDRVYLSSIFKWFGHDFIPPHEATALPGRDAAQRAVLNFIQAYLNEADRAYVAAGDYTVHYVDYDWSLNEQR